MPLLNCTVKNCLYNKDEYCAKGDILVDGRTAKKSEGTSCKSFVERRESVSNSCGCGSATPHIQVECKACECTFNKEERCDAEEITIAGRNACKCSDTECGSFSVK